MQQKEQAMYTKQAEGKFKSISVLYTQATLYHTIQFIIEKQKYKFGVTDTCMHMILTYASNIYFIGCIICIYIIYSKEPVDWTSLLGAWSYQYKKFTRIIYIH